MPTTEPLRRDERSLGTIELRPANATISDRNADGVVSRLEALDTNADGRVTHKEHMALDVDHDGEVSRKEKLDINQDGRISSREHAVIDANRDGSVTRQEVLAAAIPDRNHDGKVTVQEALKSVTTARPPLPPSAPPPRTSWKYGLWSEGTEARDEVVLVIIAIITVYQAVRWCWRRVRRRGFSLPCTSRPGYGPVAQPKVPSAADGTEMAAAHEEPSGACDEPLAARGELSGVSVNGST